MAITNAFQSILDKSERKPNKILTDQGSEFYNAHFKKWLQDNGINMYSTHNEGKSVTAERFIRTLKNKIYKHMTAISKNVYFNVLDDIVDEYNNTYHKSIGMKPIDIGDYSFAECNEESNEKDSKFKVGDLVRISKYKNIFAKEYVPNWSEEIFVVKRIKNTLPWTYEINHLNGENTLGNFYEKELQKTNQKEFRIEKVIKGKEISYMSNVKELIILLIAGLIKRSYKMSQYFFPYRSSGRNIKAELDLSSYATKIDLRNVTHVDVSSFASKTN